jgi:hypothetical protein
LAGLVTIDESMAYAVDVIGRAGRPSAETCYAGASVRHLGNAGVHTRLFAVLACPPRTCRSR